MEGVTGSIPVSSTSSIYSPSLIGEIYQMAKPKKYFKVYGIPVNPKPLREVFLETFESRNEADAYILARHRTQLSGELVYKEFKIKIGAYRFEK
jgi:hypothetical protein